MISSKLVGMKEVCFLTLIFLSLFGTQGCDDKAYSERAITILQEAGTPFENATYLASPLTHGIMQNGSGDSLHVVVIARNSGVSKMEVLPLATFRLRNGHLVRDIILATPAAPELQVIPTPTFEDFVIKNNAAKVLIDQYYSNYLGLGVTRVEEWKNAEMAKYKIDQFFMK